MSNKIKAGVIGVGAIGKNHARIYSEIDSADLVAVFDSDTDAAKEIVNPVSYTHLTLPTILLV